MNTLAYSFTIPFPLLFFAFLLIILIVGVGGILSYGYFVTRSNNALKQSMLDRGMSAEEIEQVMNAGPKSS